jgi:hypothetical protein
MSAPLPGPPLAIRFLTQWSNINMVHIAPWEVCQGPVGWCGKRAAGRGLSAALRAVQDHRPAIPPLHAAFDASLKEMDPRFGVRDVAAIAAEAALRGLMLEKQVQMLANNLSLVFRRQVAARGVG